MKRTIILTLIIAAISIQSYSQNDLKLFYFGAGVGFGFFSPGDVNELISDSYSNATEIFGSYDMYVYYVLNVKGSFFFSKYTELQLEAEWGFSPKLVSINSETDIWFYRRITPALKFNVHIPASDKLSIYFGPGINWNSLKLNTPEDTGLKSSCIGFSAQAGVMIRFRKFAIAPFIIADFINTDDSETVGDDAGYTTDIGLNYTGVHLGNTFYF